MTSINAIRFDNLSGAMGCDEQRHWNEERLKIFAADKILPVVPPEITERYRIAAAYGNTGTSGIGDELRLTIGRRIRERFDTLSSQGTEYPEKFLNMDEIAALTFATITDVKHLHVNDSLRARFGVETSEMVTGRQGGEEIKNRYIKKRVLDEIERDEGHESPSPIFGNLGILAGVGPELGFRIYLFSMREHFWEPVADGFTCQGSGGDSASRSLLEFFSARPRESLDRLDGLMALYTALNDASRLNLGVDGYFNLLLFDGTAESGKILRQVNDHRSKLCSETATLWKRGFLEIEDARRIVDELFYLGVDITDIERFMWNAVSDKRRAHLCLRRRPQGVMSE